MLWHLQMAVKHNSEICTDVEALKPCSHTWAWQRHRHAAAHCLTRGTFCTALLCVCPDIRLALAMMAPRI